MLPVNCVDRFWNLDLSYTNEKLKNRYSVCGPKPRTPSCMHRSYLLSLDFKVTFLTEWAAQLKINPLYAILSGFGDTPGVCTFYDFSFSHVSKTAWWVGREEAVMKTLHHCHRKDDQAILMRLAFFINLHISTTRYNFSKIQHITRW